MSDAVWIVGTHMTPFGRFADRDLVDLASEATVGALHDAGLTIGEVGALASGSQWGSAANLGQRLLHQVGQTGIPVYNVVNACASGATAVRTAIMAIRSGEVEVALAVGAEQLGKAGLLPGSDPVESTGTFTPAGRAGAVMGLEGVLGTFTMPGVFAQAGTEYAARHDGVGFEQFARVAQKNHEHSTLNPLSQYRKAFTLDEIMSSPMVSYPNTLLMCCPTGDGAAALVLASAARLARLPADVRRRAVKITASVLTTDPYTDAGQALTDINTLTRQAATHAYEQAGVGPDELDLVELHDCFATAELVHYDNLGLCEPGGAGDFIDRRAPWRDGQIPVNVSGGLISKGHPVGATGVASLHEVATHLRGEAGDRQIPGAAVGLAHVIGLGNTCGVHILERARQPRR